MDQFFLTWNIPNNSDTKSLSFFAGEKLGKINKRGAVVDSGNVLLFHLNSNLCHCLFGNLTLAAVAVEGDVKSGISLYDMH